MACASFRQFHHLTFSLNSSSSYSYRSGPRRLPIPTIVRSPSRIRASSAVQSDSATKEDTGLKIDLFSCPICFEPLLRKGPPGLNLPAIYRSAFKCQKCNKSYSSKDFYLDLTVTSGTETYTEFKPARTELFSLKDFWNTNTLQPLTYISLQEVYKSSMLPCILELGPQMDMHNFRNPLVSFVYERGWRQNFNRSGFPGPDDEFKMAQEYFKPAEGGLLVDVSCGSGLFSRKFAKSGTYSGVIALDFSENMLRQCYDFIKKDNTIVNANLALVRADVSRLPFPSGSVDTVHAAAALHCWPSPSNAVAEISRILRSGGVFVGSTFLANAFGNSVSSRFLRSFGQSLELTNSTYNNLTKEEIEDLCKSCGLINFTCKVQQFFIIFSAQKP